MHSEFGFMTADWPAPAAIRAGVTLRHGGCSKPPFASFNLGDHVGDQAQAVAANRARLCQELALEQEPAWLTQVHGMAVAHAGAPVLAGADASVAHARNAANAVCIVLTADCLPVLFCAADASCWGAAHAGWRGLAAGVLEATVEQLAAKPSQLLAWLGPAIGPAVFEVGQDVYDAFCAQQPQDAAAFTPREHSGKYLADIYQLARARLERIGITSIYGGGLCTFSTPERFYSYRRDGRTGRMASLIWRAG